MRDLNLNEYPHRRYNPLTREWVLVSPQRLQRPWLGQTETLSERRCPSYDPNCYLCPGNVRAGGKRNPYYKGVYVFDNDFPALLPNVFPKSFNKSALLRAHTERGICRVVCFSPRHDLSLPRLGLPAIRQVIDVWAEQTEELGKLPFIEYVQIFENRGAMMGASNPHPHGQIWATEHLPTEPAKEQVAQSEYLAKYDSCLLCDYLALELSLGERVVCTNEHFVALVPFWAVWPYETMILSRRHVSSLAALDDTERRALADILKRLTTRYDNLFRVPFPYSMGVHQQPTDDKTHPEWHLHLHFYPPLLRSATIRKFMVGYEMLAEPQRDLPPEVSAARLRTLPDYYSWEEVSASTPDHT